MPDVVPKAVTPNSNVGLRCAVSVMSAVTLGLADRLMSANTRGRMDGQTRDQDRGVFIRDNRDILELPGAKLPPEVGDDDADKPS